MRILQAQPVPPDHLGSLPGPEDITRVDLENGITVLSRANFLSPSVVVHGYLVAGALLEPVELLGLADFTASMLMRGAGGLNFQEIYDRLESVGASMGVGGGTHTTAFHARALAEDLDLLLGLLADVLRRPEFPLDYVERLRGQLLAGLAIRAQDTRDMASLAFDKVLYGDHPYARPTDGYPETIQVIRREDIADFHARAFGPKGMVVTVVGGIDPQRAVEKVAHAFADWTNPHQELMPELPPISPLEEPANKQVPIPGKSQADFLIGCVGPTRFSPDYLSAALGNNILGQFAMMGRIGESVREKAGLAYYASSSLAGGMGPGPWYASAGVAPENTERAMDLVRAEIVRFVAEPVSEDELSDSKANFIGRMPLRLESNGGVAASLLNLVRYGFPLDYYRRFPDLVQAVSREEVLETARRYLHPERMASAVAGPV